jgi:urease accessory protein
MMTTEPLTTPGVKGCLSLQFVRSGERTVLNVLEQTAPLKVVRAFDINDGATLVHLHNVSGGLLGGDELHYKFDVEPGACVQLTTTSATRIYRRRVEAGEASQVTHIMVEENALLELLPNPLIPFAGSSYEQYTGITLDDGAGLFWWETVTPGREARGEIFQYERLDLRTHISVRSRPIAMEFARLEPRVRPLSSPTRLGNYRYFSTFFICKVGVEPSRWTALESELGELARALSRPNDIQWGISTLVMHGLVVRCLSRTGRTIPPGLLAFWQAAKRSLYGLDAVPPRKVY